MPFSASTRPAPSSASPSGITSARGLPFQTSRRSRTCHPLSGTAALQADCRRFCPYYVLASEVLDLIVIGSPLLAGQGNRRLRTELRCACEREWFHVGPGRRGHIRGRHIDPWLCLGPIRIGRI